MGISLPYPGKARNRPGGPGDSLDAWLSSEAPRRGCHNSDASARTEGQGRSQTFPDGSGPAYFYAASFRSRILARPHLLQGLEGGDMYLESGRKGTCCLDDAGQAASVVAAHRTLCVLCTTQGHSRRSQTSTTSGKGHTGARPPSPAPRRDDWEVGG